MTVATQRSTDVIRLRMGKRRNDSGQWATTHGFGGRAKTREYQTWVGIKQRCYDTNSKDYPKYGGSGIRVANAWIHDATAFIGYMGPRPAGCSIDRIDPTGDYAPGNVRWATSKEQARNRRVTKINVADHRFVMHWLDVGCRPVDVAQAFGVPSTTIYSINHR